MRGAGVCASVAAVIGINFVRNLLVFTNMLMIFGHCYDV